MFGLGIGEGLIILVIVLLLFGGRKLPELGSSMGKALMNFKKGMSESNSELKEKIEQNNNNDDNSSGSA